MNRETVERYDAPDASSETPGHWEVNYLLPQLLPGSEYPGHDVNAALLRVVKRLFAALRTRRFAPPVTPSLSPYRSHRNVYR
ncbi:hypothetical protein LJR071_000780 [Pseudomonas sp. LjRoot71]|uniref:hypothetical protein n=1 Tax=Pseudomonas sp. LjRoot71 TaxID=3342336 RepID=UPI003ECD898D